MNKLIKVISVAVLSILPILSYAVSVERTTNWNNERRASVFFNHDNSSELNAFSALIERSKSGKQGLYFIFEGERYRHKPLFEDSEFSRFRRMVVPSYDYDSSRDVSMVFNTQAVKMLQIRDEGYNTDGSSYYFYYYTPKTEEGKNYVINLFKRATRPVRIEYRGDVFYMPAIGFTREWNRSGGDAI